MPRDGASTLGPDVPSAEASAATLVARGLSVVINPLLLPPLLFGLVLGHLGASLAEIGWAVSVGFVFFALLPLAYVVRLWRREHIAAIDIPTRARRWRPLLVSVAAYLCALAVLGSTAETGAALLAALAGLHAGNALLILVVTLRWKISVHTAALGGFISMLLFVAQTPWPDRALEEALLAPGVVGVLVLVLAALAWARVHLGAHTPGQAVGGALFGLAMPYAELSLLAAGELV